MKPIENIHYELVHASECFDDDNNGLIYGIHWIYDNEVIECNWFDDCQKREDYIQKQNI
jgi:hypothetical protein